jgi:hypothetical protein
MDAKECATPISSARAKRLRIQSIAAAQSYSAQSSFVARNPASDAGREPPIPR